MGKACQYARKSFVFAIAVKLRWRYSCFLWFLIFRLFGTFKRTIFRSFFGQIFVFFNGLKVRNSTHRLNDFVHIIHFYGTTILVFLEKFLSYSGLNVLSDFVATFVARKILFYGFKILAEFVVGIFFNVKNKPTYCYL